VPRRATELTTEQKANAQRIRKARQRAKDRYDALDTEMNADVVQLRSAGVSLRAIADIYGLNHQTVQNIVNRTTADA
jgi:DNA-binding CsgD family transcriptional regulator